MPSNWWRAAEVLHGVEEAGVPDVAQLRLPHLPARSARAIELSSAVHLDSSTPVPITGSERRFGYRSARSSTRPDQDSHGAHHEQLRIASRRP